MADHTVTIARTIEPFLGHQEKIAELEEKIRKLEAEERRVAHFAGHARYALEQLQLEQLQLRDGNFVRGSSLHHVWKMILAITGDDSSSEEGEEEEEDEAHPNTSEPDEAQAQAEAQAEDA